MTRWLIALVLCATTAQAQCPHPTPHGPPTPGLVERVLSNLFLPQEADAICCHKDGVDCQTPVPGYPSNPSITPCATTYDVIDTSSCIGPGDVAAPSCVSKMVAVWDFESAGTPYAQVGGTCGADCNLTPGAGVSRDTSVYQQGAASGLWTGASNATLNCATSTCNELLLSGAHTWFAWGYFTGSSDAGLVSLYAGDAAHGEWMERNNGATRGHVVACNGTDCFTESSGSSTFATSAWHHVVNVSNGTTVQLYQDGAAQTASGAVTISSTGVTTFNVGAVTATYANWTGNIDDVAVYSGAASAEAICYVCTCNVDGSACTRNGTAFVSTPRHAACGNCTLPTDASVCPLS